MKTRSIAILVLFLVAVLVVWKTNRPVQESGDESRSQTASNPNLKSAPRDSQSAADSVTSRPDASNARKQGSEDNAAPVTKPRDREKPNFDAKRLATVDMTLPADEATPQQGPQLFAELRTLSKRHTNLTPNHLGIMPRIRVAPSEPMLVTLTLPDASPGDRLHAELTDGGHFLDIEEAGRIYTVGKNKTVEIRFEASEQDGHCNLALLQNGHSRILPLWVGPPQELATQDPK